MAVAARSVALIDLRSPPMHTHVPFPAAVRNREEIQALKIQLSYARDQVRDLDRKLSQEVAARSALEASRDYAGADAH